MTIREVISAFSEHQHFVLVSHVSPDGDSVGSLLALQEILATQGKCCVCVILDELPKRFNFLPGYEKIRSSLDEEVLGQSEVLVALDCGSRERTGLKGKINCSLRVNIDHHADNSLFADLNWVDSHAAAVGEMLYALVDELNITLNREIAACLYTAIASDTGGFRYANTTSRTHQIASRLLEKGIDASYIMERIMASRSFAQLRLLVDVLSTARVEDGVGTMELSQRVLTESGVRREDIADLVNYIRSVDEVQVAAMFTELESGITKVSLRTREPFDASKLAHRFGGGGHVRAAGCRITKPLIEARELVTQAARDLLEV